MDRPCDPDRASRIIGRDLADGVKFSVGLLLVLEDIEPRRLRLDPAVDLELAQLARDRVDIGGNVGNLGTDEIEAVVRIAAHGVSDTGDADRRMNAILTLSHGLPSER
jgi:hypothetical protein